MGLENLPPTAEIEEGYLMGMEGSNSRSGQVGSEVVLLSFLTRSQSEREISTSTGTKVTSKSEQTFN